MMIRRFFIHPNRKATSSNNDNNIKRSSTTGTIVNSRCFTESSSNSSDSDSTEQNKNKSNNDNSLNTIVSSPVAVPESLLVCTGYFSTFCDYCGNNCTVQKNVCMYQCIICKLYYYCSMECYHNDTTHTIDCDSTTWITRTIVTTTAAVAASTTMPTITTTTTSLHSSNIINSNNINHHLPLLSDNDNRMENNLTKEIHHEIGTTNAMEEIVINDQYDSDNVTENILVVDSINPKIIDIHGNDNEQNVIIGNCGNDTIKLDNILNQEGYSMIEKNDKDNDKEEREREIEEKTNKQKVIIGNSSDDTIKLDSILNEEGYSMIDKNDKENDRDEGEGETEENIEEEKSEVPKVDEKFATDVDISKLIRQRKSNEGLENNTLQDKEEPELQQESGFGKNNLLVKEQQQHESLPVVYTDDSVDVSIVVSNGKHKQEITSRTVADKMINVSTVCPITIDHNDVVVLDQENEEYCTNCHIVTTMSKSIETEADSDIEKQTTNTSTNTTEKENQEIEEENKTDSDNCKNDSKNVEVDTINTLLTSSIVTLEKHEEDVDEQEIVIDNGTHDLNNAIVDTVNDSVTETTIEVQTDNNAKSCQIDQDDNDDNINNEVEQQIRMMIQSDTTTLVDEIVQDNIMKKIDDISGGGSNENMCCDSNKLEHIDCRSTNNNTNLPIMTIRNSSSSSNNNEKNSFEAIQSKPNMVDFESEVDSSSGKSHVVIEPIQQNKTNEFCDRDNISFIVANECSNIPEATISIVTEQIVTPVSKSNNRTMLSVATSGDTLDNVILRKCQDSNNINMSKDYERDTPDWVHQARTHSASVLSSLSTLSPRSKAIPKRTVSLQLDDITLRHGIVPEQKVYDWEKPEWVDENNLNRSYDTIEEIERRLEENKQNGLSSLNNSSIIEIEQLELRHAMTIEKKEYEWEKPAWVTKTKLRSNNNTNINRTTNVPITMTTTNMFCKSISDTERSKINEWQTNTEKSNKTVTTEIESKIGENKDDMNTIMVESNKD